MADHRHLPEAQRKAVATALASIKAEKKISQEDLGQLLGFTQEGIRKALKGSGGYSIRDALLDYLRMDVDELLERFGPQDQVMTPPSSKDPRSVAMHAHVAFGTDPPTVREAAKAVAPLLLQKAYPASAREWFDAIDHALAMRREREQSGERTAVVEVPAARSRSRAGKA